MYTLHCFSITVKLHLLCEFHLCELCESSAGHLNLYYINELLCCTSNNAQNVKMHKLIESCKFLKRPVLMDLHNFLYMNTKLGLKWNSLE